MKWYTIFIHSRLFLSYSCQSFIYIVLIFFLAFPFFWSQLAFGVGPIFITFLYVLRPRSLAIWVFALICQHFYDLLPVKKVLNIFFLNYLVYPLLFFLTPMSSIRNFSYHIFIDSNFFPSNLFWIPQSFRLRNIWFLFYCCWFHAVS